MSYSINVTVTETSFDPVNNQTTITWSYTLHSTLSSQFQNWTLNTWFKINGTKVYTPADRQYSMTGSTATDLPMGSSTAVITHATDGTSSITVEGYVNAVSQQTWTPNNVSSGVQTKTLTTFTPGNRWNGSAMVDTSTYKRYNGSSWVTLTTKKRYNGTTWVNISN